MPVVVVADTVVVVVVAVVVVVVPWLSSSPWGETRRADKNTRGIVDTQGQMHDTQGWS